MTQEPQYRFTIPSPSECTPTAGDHHETHTPYGIVFRHVFLPAGNTFETSSRSYDEPYIHLQFNLDCSGSTTADGDTYTPFNANIFLALIGNGQQRIRCTAEKDADIFIFDLSFSFLERNLPADHPWLKAFTPAVPEQATAFPVSPEMRSILFDLVFCPLESRYRNLFLKAKTLELLVFQMEYLEKKEMDIIPAGLKAADVKRMQHAKEIILSNLRNPPGIQELAQQVGTNENYLKKYFKAVHGTTVYHFISKARMEKAKQLLSTEKRPLSEVAGMMGYKHVHHFSTAFRKIFGFSPVRLRALLLGLLQGEEWVALLI